MFSLLYRRHAHSVCDKIKNIVNLGKKWHRCLICREIIKSLSPRNTHEKTNVREATGMCIQWILSKCFLCVIPWHKDRASQHRHVDVQNKTCTPAARVGGHAVVLPRQKMNEWIFFRFYNDTHQRGFYALMSNIVKSDLFYSYFLLFPRVLIFSTVKIPD